MKRGEKKIDSKKKSLLIHMIYKEAAIIDLYDIQSFPISLSHIYALIHYIYNKYVQMATELMDKKRAKA
jgi:hypothetical protein